MQKISRQTSRATLRRLGKLLGALGRFADALPVWERLVVDGQVNEDARRFVDCAGRLGRDDMVLKFCATARRDGIFDEALLQWEMRLLDRYDPDAALSLLEEITRRDPTNRRAWLHLVHLALRLGKKDLAETHVGNLPSVNEADAEEGAAAVAVLTAVGRSADALAYAYDLLRRHFQDHHAHRAFRDAVVFRDQTNELEIPPEAGPGVAVCLAEESAPAPQWFVIEDSEVQASAVENEIRVDSPLARRLVGKKIGDEVALSEGPGLKRMAVVRELLPKHVFRVRDVWERWQYRFPDHQEMWMIRVPRSGDDEKLDLSSLFDLANAQHRRVKEAEAIYSKNLIPIWLFGKAAGKREMYAVGHIASTEGLMLRCCVGSTDEYEESVNALKAAAEVVVDVTALTTLMMLEELTILEVLGKTVLVTHSTMAAVRTLVEEARKHVRSEGSMGADDAGPRLIAPSPEDKGAALDAAERFQRIVECNCRLLPSTALADVDVAERKWLEEAMGPSALESIVLAAAASRVVWTDDHAVALIGRDKFGTKRVWTQGVLRSLNEQGIIPNERYARATARLLGWRYMFTSVNPEVMRVAGNQAEWKPERWPLKQALVYLSLDVVRLEDAAMLSAMLVAYCYRDAVLPETRRVLLQAAAEGLASRVDADRTVPLFGSILRRAFGLNVAGEQDATETFEAWNREYLRRFTAVRS